MPAINIVRPLEPRFRWRSVAVIVFLFVCHLLKNIGKLSDIIYNQMVRITNVIMGHKA